MLARYNPPIPALPPNPTRWCIRRKYPLNAVTDNRCPECGKGFDPDDKTTFVTDMEGHRWLKAMPWLVVGSSSSCLSWRLSPTFLTTLLL